MNIEDTVQAIVNRTRTEIEALLVESGRHAVVNVMVRLEHEPGGGQRCDGRYPVPQTSPPRDEPFEVTYRCALEDGHEGAHGS